MRLIALALIAGLAATSLSAAVHADLDLAAIRQVDPDLIAALPRPPAGEHLVQILAERFAFDPRRDLQRVIIDHAGPGHPPVLHLTGLPTAAISAALRTADPGETVPAGIMLLIPGKPGAGFIALDGDEALVGPLSTLRTTPKPAVDTAPAAAPILVSWTPGEHVPEPLTGVNRIDLRGDAQGHLSGTITCIDDPAAAECERRLGVVRAMIEVGAAGKLPKAVLAKQVLAATTVTRQGARLLINLTIPEGVRKQAIARLTLLSKG